MRYYRLKEEHPLTQKIRELEHIMDEMGLHLSVGFNSQLYVYDTETDEYYQYRDLEHAPDGYETTQQFPLGFETKLIIEKDE